MIKLYQFAPAFGLANASPFCMKLETYLRMAQLPFEIAPPRMSDFNKAPKGKMPYIEDQGKLIADSTFAIDYLKATYGDKLDGGLSAEQKAVALAMQRLIEENLYWVLIHLRWVEPAGWHVVKAQPAFATMPVPLKWFVPSLARRGLIKALHGQGMGRHSAAEICAIGQRDVTALADYLADKPYFMGNEPCSFDATAYATIANIVWVPVDSSVKQHAQQYPQLQAYCQRMKARYYA